MAAANWTGRSELILTKDAGGATLKTAGNPPDRVGSLMVDTIIIDEFIQSNGLRKPDVIKIDVEGAELNALKGMSKVLQEKGPILIVEFDDATAVGCEKKLSACREFLENIGYLTKNLPNSYNNEKWFVLHLVAMHPKYIGTRPSLLHIFQKNCQTPQV